MTKKSLQWCEKIDTKSASSEGHDASNDDNRQPKTNMKVTINKLASKRLLEAFAKVGACRTEEQAEARMSKLLGVPAHVIYYRSEEITEIDMRAATGEGSLFPARVSVEGSVPLYKLAALVKDALPTLAVGVVTYNNHMQPSIN